MGSRTLMLKWSWRDLRANWTKVFAIALVIAIGTGGYAGLTSNAEWRRTSYAAAYDGLAMYDLRIDLAAGSFVPEGTLRSIVAAIPEAAAVEAIEERLLVPTLLDASHGDATVLVRSEITGTDFSDGGPAVNGYHAFTGRPLDASDAGSLRVMVERSFAAFYDLPATGTVTVSGGRVLEYVGQATTPEYFAVAAEGEILLSEANFGALFTTLETARELAGRPGAINDAVLTLHDGADRDAVQRQLEDGLAAAGLGAEVVTRDDNLAYSALNTDVDNDQQMFDALAFLLFAGAAGAAFNLIHRLAEQQRREIGVSMALGIPARRIAVRPFLVSAQIAVLGVVLGIGVGVLIGNGFKAVFESYVPLPEWQTPFLFRVYATAAVIGFLIPFLATALPIMRAVRVTPVEAIRPPHLAAQPGKARSRRSFRANTFRVMPFRNLGRAKRRSLLTIVGIGAVVTVLVAFLGLLDSVFAALDDAEAEAVGESPGRITVMLDGFYPDASSPVQAVADAATVAVAEPTLRAGAVVFSPGAEFDVLIEFLDFDDGMWTPTIVSGTIDARPGLVLAVEAARDLGDLSAGDLVGIRYPVRTGPDTFELVDGELPILALHPYPIRTFAYMDSSHAALVGLAGIANLVHVAPAPGSDLADVQQELFGIDAVASVQSVAAPTEAVRDQMGAFFGIIQVMMLAVLVLAVLIAFNTASINLDSRAREHATMFAYGIPVRTALRMAVIESLVIGIVATAVGVAGGVAMLSWMTGGLLATTLPEIGIAAVLRPLTIVTVVGLGVVAVAVAPVFTIRRMRRIDLPGTLRLVE